MNRRQERFVDFYIQTANATEAARRAGYSTRSARQIGEKLLTKHDISLEIKRRLSEIKTQRTVDTQEILEHLSAVIRGEVEETLMTPGGKKVVIPVRESDKLVAAEKLLRVFGAYRDKIDVKMDASEMFKAALAEIWSDEKSDSGD